MEKYRVDVRKFKNTDKFRPAVLHYEKNGFYCAATKGTSSYKDYWDEEIERCKYGFTAEDGDFITGYHYYYLNFCQINRIVIDKKTKKPIPKFWFPRFFDYDHEFFMIVEECEKQGKHLAVLKARRKGYSYKIAAMLARNFYLYPNSKNYAYASENEFLVKDGILSKVWQYMDFIDENTAWYKKRQKIDTKMHKRASMVIDKEGVKVEVGYKSEVIGVTLKNDVQKIRGKGGKLIIFEEAGKFPDLKEAWTVARPSVEQGGDVHGLMIAFGTGGTEDANFDGLKDLFYEPDGYNCLVIENIWDDGASEPCGFFVPAYYNLDNSTMDDQGNSLVKKAATQVIAEREKIVASATDRTAVDRYIAENCLSPQEATLQISSNIFPKNDLIKHLAYIRNNKKIQEFKQVGDLVIDEKGGIVWQQSERPKDLTRYRLQKDTDPTGEIVIWEHPIDDPPYGLYIAGCDPYDHDQSSSGSLGSIYIYKRFQQFDSTHDILVAEYTGRPKTAELFYDKTRRMLSYYSAKLLFENQNPGILTYFRQKHCDYLLADQPDIIDKIVKKSTVQRAKGMHMNKEIKIDGEGRIKDWLISERGDGRMGLHTILSEPLLEELVAYNPEGNFDRVMALMMVIFYKEELYNVKLKENKLENREVTFFGVSPFVGDTNEFNDSFFPEPAGGIKLGNVI